MSHPLFAVSCCIGWDSTDGWSWCGCLVVLFSCLFFVLVGWVGGVLLCGGCVFRVVFSTVVPILS